MRRRELLITGATAAGYLALGPSFWQRAFAAPAVAGTSPYGELGPPDANGIALPDGFTARLIARYGEPVQGTGYAWHMFSDGQATYALEDGGWILVSNAETIAQLGGGSSAIRFDSQARIRDAYRICSDTHINCAGGRTPWGTWLTCEEIPIGQVWECDPLGREPAVNRPAMGSFKHEAAAVDPVHEHVYMTEDEGDGCFYRFVPDSYPDLSSGRLEVLVAHGDGPGSFVPVPDPSALVTPTRQQVPGAARFSGGEGIWFDSGIVYFTAKGKSEVWAWDTGADSLECLYRGDEVEDAFLDGPDNCTVSRSGDLFVCEDNGQDEFEIVMMTPDRELSPFLRCSGPLHAGSELSGVMFDPAGDRMYFASQRAFGGSGAVFEVTGPFRPARPDWRMPEPIDRADPSPEPPPTVEDVDAPGLEVRAQGRISLAALRRGGLRIRVEVDEAAEVTAVLRTHDLATEPGQRGSSERPSPTTLGKASTSLAGPGRAGLRLRPKPAKARRVARRLARPRRRGGRPKVRARLVVQAVDRAGNVRVANRRVSIGAPVKPKARNRR